MSASTDPASDASSIRVLLAEDEANLGMILQQYLSARGFDVTVVRDGRAALDALRSESFDVALLDVVMPGMDGLEVLRVVREEPPSPEIIVMTGNGTSETAMIALQLGAYDFLSKPYRMAEVEAMVRRAWEKRLLLRDNHVLRNTIERLAGDHRFVTQYAPLVAVMTMVNHVAPSRTPVLVSGEVGTGKRHVARLLHDRGLGPRGPFLEMNCAMLNAAEQALALFGGGGSDGERRIGLLEMAHGGSLYLEQIDALDAAVQATLARALEDRYFVRGGGEQRVRVHVRVVASTTGDLSRWTPVEPMDPALLHHVTAVQVSLPPLRDRLVDVLPLSEHFCSLLHGATPMRVTPSAVAALERYHWPGNVRELRAVIERALLIATDGRIESTDLALDDRADVAAHAKAEGEGLTLQALERRHIAAALARTQWHQGRAAEALGISPKTLYRKIREYGLARPTVRREGVVRL